EENQTARLERDMFWQLPGDWLSQGDALPYPVTMIMDASGRRHPRRRAKPAGEVYRRFDTGIQAWVSLRTLDIEEDLHRFMRWQNSERVAAFWEQSGTLEEHRAYLESQAKESRVLNLIGCIDDEPFAYFEAYWAKEDRIAPYYDAQDFDRGIHMLVGEDHHRGPHKVKAWLNALCHYLFLDDCRTTRIVSEPRSDNDRMIQHLQARRFAKPKEFDFPHKRAALMVLHRDAFFERCELS
ncbi:siderophore biosynthesis protein, partial [Alcanivorax sp. HI0083]